MVVFRVVVGDYGWILGCFGGLLFLEGFQGYCWSLWAIY